MEVSDKDNSVQTVAVDIFVGLLVAGYACTGVGRDDPANLVGGCELAGGLNLS